jgi:hypothetical protein
MTRPARDEHNLFVSGDSGRREQTTDEQNKRIFHD